MTSPAECNGRCYSLTEGGAGYVDPECPKHAAHLRHMEPLCLAERKPWSACFLIAGHEGDHVWSYNGAV